MNIAIVLAAVTALATTAGGALALRSRDRLHLVLGLSAGLLLGLVSFDLLPEVFDASQSITESDYGHEHSHAAHIAGTLGALAMGGHVFLDGVALGVAFQVSNKLGVAVFIALLTHAFSDGLNTVSLLIKTGSWNKRATWLLGVDALARIGGASLGTYVAFSDSSLAIYLALFSGFLIYLATSHILPEAHSRHPSRLTMAATVVGVAAMWIVVSTLG